MHCFAPPGLRASVAAAAAILMAGATLGLAQNPGPLSLKDALALAEKNDQALRVAAGDAASAREDALQTKAARYPTLTGRSEYLGTQGNGTLPSGRFVTNDGVHVYREWGVVHQDLSPGVLARTAVRRADAAEALSRAKVEIARRGLAAAVTRTFYTLAVAQRKYATAQVSLEQAQKALEISRNLERGREVAHSDVVRSQLQENGQQQAVQEARFAMDNARLDLAVMLYQDFRDDFTIVDDLESPPALPSLDNAQEMAARNNPTLAAALLALRAASLDVKLARQAYLPTLTVDAAYGIEANALALHSTVAANKEAGPLPNLGYFVTASLNIPLWDWGVRHSKVKQSEIARHEAAADLSLAQRTAVRNLRGFYNEAQTARRQIELLQRSVDLASEGLRLSTLRYQAGEATIIDLVDAQTGFLQSRNAFDDGLLRYRLAIGNLQTLTGTF